ncbi:MAG: tRNA 2-thiocytidine(32) synthetase TtcA [Muribaculaceae bacterium]|nr:tRNA 2-thiocytidine(32) synthetase TtcA [Roseburia sp.]MCM1430295.1 tRNA 2-thiocytidine(32) synthetase TtcA [Muribaculaceae bacterium]MCM1492509.1 tRNA 2-thiocytidine(32) synthetase TtcA [Muribaculaceae bacterium]
MKLQQLYSLVRQAVQDYRMIEEGDRIAIGISGGKDSLALLYALAGLRRFYPISYELVAITVDLGFKDMDFSRVRKLCETLHVEYHIVTTNIGRIVFEEKKDSSHCSLCAKMRKGALNQRALALGCNKIAYAHHKDDMVETALLSLFYEGRFYCFPPVTRLEHTGLTVIRPLMYVRECEVLGFLHKYELPVVNNSCPADRASKRSYIKQTFRQLMKDNPEIKKHVFHAIQEAELPDWPDKI